MALIRQFAIRNELLYSGFVLPNVQIFFAQKISFATFGVSIDDFFTRYAGLGYSLIQYFLKIIVYDHSIFIIDQHNKAIGIINIAKPFLNFMDETMI